MIKLFGPEGRQETEPKVLMVVGADADLLALKNELLAVDADLEKRIEDLRHMAKHINDQAEGRRATVWANVATVAKARGVLPVDYDPAKHGLGFAFGALMIRDKDDDHGCNCTCPVCFLARLTGEHP